LTISVPPNSSVVVELPNTCGGWTESGVSLTRSSGLQIMSGQGLRGVSGSYQFEGSCH
jgi:hypothetical protein